MIGFNHALAGSIVAVVVPAPFVPIVAVISHFILDAFPHFSTPDNPQDTYKKPYVYVLVADGVVTLLCVGFAWYLFPEKVAIILVGIFFSMLPDVLWLLEGKVRWMNLYFKFANGIQWGERPWGWSLEILYAMTFVLILFGLDSPR